MFRWMLEQNQVNLMRGGQERQSFWYEVLRAAKGHLLDKGKNKAAGKAKK